MNMRVTFDTNVILDIILKRPGSEAALELAHLIAREEISGLVSANSITDIYYIARKIIGDMIAREAIADILMLFDVAAIDGDICSMALNTAMSDYEDAVLAVCAAQEGADYIATRDEALIRAECCPVTALRPVDVMKAIRNTRA